MTHTAALNGANELRPNDSQGKGQLYLGVDEQTGSVLFAVKFDGLLGEPTGLHIHQGGVGEGGPMVYDLGAAAKPVGLEQAHVVPHADGVGVNV